MLQALRISPASFDSVLGNTRQAELQAGVRPVVTGPLLLVEDQMGVARQAEVIVGRVRHMPLGRLTAEDGQALGEDFNGLAARMAGQSSADMITLVEFRQPRQPDEQVQGYEAVKRLPPAQAFSVVSRAFFQSLEFKANMVGRTEALAAMVGDAVDLVAFGAQLASQDKAAAAPVVVPSMSMLRDHYGPSAFDAIAVHSGLLIARKGILPTAARP